MSVFQEDLLAGQVAFVTGGGSGIGLAIVEALVEHGARVAICGRTQDKLDAVQERLGDAILPVVADVRQAEALEAVIQAIDEQWGRLDILVNNAAGNFLCPAVQLSSNGFGTVVDIDLKGTFNACKAAFELLSERGGSIVNISATLHYTGTPMQIHASSAKAGVDAITRNLAVEWGPLGIRTNAIAPGPIDDTEGMTKLAPGDIKERFEKRIPLQRYGRASEIADTVLFLVSDAASYTNGAVLVVDGGQWLATSGLGIAFD